MSLPKSLRPRYRYVFFEVETLGGEHVTEGGLRRALWFESQNLFGDLVSARSELALVEYGEGLGAVKCRHDTVDETRAALACVDEVDGVRAGVVVVGVSGTLAAGRGRYEPPGDPDVTEVDGVRRWSRGSLVDREVEEGRDADSDGVDARGAEQHPVICGTTYDFR